MPSTYSYCGRTTRFCFIYWKESLSNREEDRAESIAESLFEIGGATVYAFLVLESEEFIFWRSREGMNIVFLIDWAVLFFSLIGAERGLLYLPFYVNKGICLRLR